MKLKFFRKLESSRKCRISLQHQIGGYIQIHNDKVLFENLRFPLALALDPVDSRSLVLLGPRQGQGETEYFLFVDKVLFENRWFPLALALDPVDSRSLVLLGPRQGQGETEDFWFNGKVLFGNKSFLEAVALDPVKFNDFW